MHIYIYVLLLPTLSSVALRFWKHASARFRVFGGGTKFAHARERFLVLGIPGKSIICIYIHIIAFSLPTGGRKSAQTHNNSPKLLWVWALLPPPGAPKMRPGAPGTPFSAKVPKCNTFWGPAMCPFALLRHSARMENATKRYYSNVFSKFRNSVKSGISRSRARTLRNVGFHDFPGNRKMHESVYIYVRDASR